jgi:hypothetical protein
VTDEDRGTVLAGERPMGRRDVVGQRSQGILNNGDSVAFADQPAPWHRTKRFARVAQHGDFVVLEMNVWVTGGVAPAYLAFAMRLWMQMMGEFFLHLRNYSPAAETRGDAANSESRAAIEGVASAA